MLKSLDQRLFDDMVKWASSPTVRDFARLVASLHLSADLLRDIEVAGRLVQGTNTIPWKQISEIVAQQAFVPLSEAELQTLRTSLTAAFQAKLGSIPSPRLQHASNQLIHPVEQPPTLAEVVHEAAKLVEDAGYAPETEYGGREEAPSEPAPNATVAPRDGQVPSKGRHKPPSGARRVNNHSRAPSRTASSSLSSRGAEGWGQFSNEVRHLSLALEQLTAELHQASNNEQDGLAAPPAELRANDERSAWSFSDKMMLAQLIMSILALVLQFVATVHGIASPPVMVNPPPPVASPPPPKK